MELVPSTTTRRCTLDDIHAVVNQPALFTVEEGGDAVDWYDSGRLDVTRIDNYQCENCGEWFEVQPYKQERTWPEVLEHVMAQPVAPRE